MARWHDHNPWATTLIYVPLKEWLSALAGGKQSIAFYKDAVRRHNWRVDCYILPQSNGTYSMGMRYGKQGHSYYSPPANDYRCAELAARFNPTPA